MQLVHAAEDGVALQAAALASGFEGVVGKRKESRYEAGRRSASWLKVKPTRSADFVIGGYTKGKGARAPLGAILVGYWDQGQLRYASHVGSGFDERTLAQVKARLEPLQRKTWPFAEKPELNAPTTWVEPVTVAEVSFQSWTDDDHLRAPVFLRLRDDIDPKAVRRTEPGPAPDAAPLAIHRRAVRSTTSSRSSKARKPRSRSPWDRTGSASRTSIACTGPRIRRASSRRSPSATCSPTSRRSRPTCCRILPIARSR